MITLKDVRYTWPGTHTPVIDIESFELQAGERVFLRGPSGSGKTTLLSLIAGVLKPDQGQVLINGQDLTQLRSAAADRFRADHTGLVFQQFNLLPFLNVLENVQLPCRFSRLRRQRALSGSQTLDAEAARLLEAMQLPAELHRVRAVMQLSVGQQQRAAVARALMGRPSLLIADEPTSALDTDARAAFMQLLFREVEAAGSALLFVSHDPELAARFDRAVDLRALNRQNAPLVNPQYV